MSDPKEWIPKSTDGAGNVDRVEHATTGEEGRVYFGMGGEVGDVRNDEGESIGRYEE